MPPFQATQRTMLARSSATASQCKTWATDPDRCERDRSFHQRPASGQRRSLCRRRLDVGEIWYYTASHSVTQAEIDAGVNIVNTATADSDQTGPDTDDASVPVLQAPALAIDKAITGVTGRQWQRKRRCGQRRHRLRGHLTQHRQPGRSTKSP
ncbi:hypothetical protein GHT06_007460 [Daphnia sinensis]|uniref:Uncharacterized protein n=1 Tax=Daphnia sinensis TaxID=1820382 RepID=A0AAD5KUH9_9CRUS|nr:hypothetical protein GHT06_007460 [Daphnia sinensis]